MSDAKKPDARLKILEKTNAYSGFFRLNVYRLRHRKFAGGWTRELTRELLERGHAAAVLPYDPRRDEVVLIEQFRIGAWAAGMEAWTIEIIAGVIDPGETPEAVVRREAKEEAGLDLGPLQSIGRYLTTPGGSSETHHLFIGQVDSSDAGGLHGLRDEEEDIRVLVMPLAAALRDIELGRIANFTAVAALQWLGLHKDRLLLQWRGTREP